MERILELAKQRADHAEVFRIERNHLPVCYRGGKIATVEAEDMVGTTLRVIVNGRLGFSSTTHPTEAEELVDRAVAAAQVGPEISLAFPDVVVRYGQTAVYDPAVAALTAADLIETGNAMVGTVLAAFPDIGISAEMSRAIENVTVMNTHGGHVSYSKTLYQAFAAILMTLHEDRAELEHGYSGTHLDDGPMDVANQAVWRFNNCHRVVPLRGGRLPVIFTSLSFRGIYVPLYFALNGMAAHRKTSLLAERIGDKVAHEAFSIADDPAMPTLPGSCPCDDEGVPTRRLPLIERGVFRNFFYDLRAAGLAGVASTGNGFKKGSLYEGFRLDAPPSGYPANFVLEPGELTLEQMIGDIKHGIIVDDVIGAGQGNNLNGEFSMSVALGYKVENGEITGRIKDVMVAGNIFDLLPNLRGMTRQRFSEDTLFGRYLVPWTCFDDVSVATQ